MSAILASPGEIQQDVVRELFGANLHERYVSLQYSYLRAIPFAGVASAGASCPGTTLPEPRIPFGTS